MAQDDAVVSAKVAAKRALLSSIPDHVMKELQAHADQAKLEAEQLKVGAAASCRPCSAWLDRVLWWG